MRGERRGERKEGLVRKRVRLKGTTADLARGYVNQMLAKRPAQVAVVLGPVVWTIPEGSDQKRWYFVIAYGEGGGERFMLEQITGPRPFVEEVRHTMLPALIEHGPIVIHDCDSDLGTATWINAQFPGDRSERMLEMVRKEQGEDVR